MSVQFENIKGQEACKRAMTVALAGGHSIALVGPRGCGKTMLRQAASKLRGDTASFEARVVTTEDGKRRYVSAETGESMDREIESVDIFVEVPPVPFRELTSARTGTSSAGVRDQVKRAHEFVNTHPAAELSNGVLLLGKHAYEELDLCAADWAALLRVARTIANLDRSHDIREHHLAEAIQYRIR